MGLGSTLRYVRGRVIGRVYSIGIFTGPSPLSLGPPPGVENPVLTRDSVTDVRASFVADPFIIRTRGSWFMFFEVLALRPEGRKGEIAVATSADGLRWSYRAIVLAEPFHLSYPYVFASGSDYYMIPESAQAHAARLYRADPFPDRWTFVTELARGPVLLDNSIVHRDGWWWMFSQTAPERGGTLRLFHARELAGPWREHPRSPIVTGDPRIARPAGRIVSFGDRLVRFAQDCRSNYGASVSALEITRLSADDYAEVELERNPILHGVGRGWNALGMHHVDPHCREDGTWLASVDGWSNHVRRPGEVLWWASRRLRPARVRGS